MDVSVPVFLFIGFLGSGKTTLINDFMSQNLFARVNTLVILSERGEESPVFPNGYEQKITVKTVKSADQIDRDLLLAWQRETACHQVIIEYNGMWSLKDLSDEMPGNWILLQSILTAESKSFVLFNTNMRNLIVEKLRNCSAVMFNRICDASSVPELRRIVRTVNRKTEIYYEYENGECEKDESGDLLPYDLNLDDLQIEDEAFAVWQLDMRTFPEKYAGKKVTFHAEIFSGGYVGRPVMTCCEADIERIVFQAEDRRNVLPDNGWACITAEIKVTGQMIRLNVLFAEACEAPAYKVAVF